LHGIKTISITDSGHIGQASPLTEIGFYCFSNSARQFSNNGHSFYGTMGAFDGLTSVSIKDLNDISPTSIKIVHNGAFFAGPNTIALQSVDFGPSNQLTVFDEPTGPSSFQSFGHIYGLTDGDYSSNSSIFGNQSALTSIDLHQSFYGDTTKTQRSVLLNIPANCFQGCTSLKSIQGNRDKILNKSGVQLCAINIPSSVQSIGTNAFDGVPVQILNLPTSLKSLGTKILGPNGSSALTDITFSDPNPDANFLNSYD
jgi:hypothetical protein